MADYVVGANAIGANPVYDTSGSVNYFLKNIQQQQAKRAAEQKALQEDLSKVKIDGVRDADKADYYKGYQDWRDAAQAALKETDFRKKAELQSQAIQKQLELQNLVNQSKQYGKQYGDLKSRLLDNKMRDQFTDDAITQLQNSDKLPIKNPGFIKDFTTLARQSDYSKIPDMLDKLDSHLLSRSQEANPSVGESIKAGNRTGTMMKYQTTVKPEEQLLNYGLAYDANRDFKGYIQDQYPDLFQKYPEEQAKGLALKDFADKRPIQKVRQAPVWDNIPDRYYDHLRAREAARSARGEEGYTGTPQTLNIPYAKGTANFQADQYIPVSIPKKNFAGSTYIDLKTGQPSTKKLRSSDDYSVVGVNNTPILKVGTSDNTGKAIPAGSVVQPKFANSNPGMVTRTPTIHVQLKEDGITRDYLIPYDRLPENVKNSKSIKAALSSFKPAQEKSSTPSKSSIPTKSTGKKQIKGF